MMKSEFDKLVDLVTDHACYERIEYVYSNCPFFSETNGKREIAAFYQMYDMNGIERLYRETLKIEKMRRILDEVVNAYESL